MHDFSHISAFPVILMFTVFAFAAFLPMLACASVLFARKAWSADGAMPLPWIHRARMFDAMGSSAREQTGAPRTDSTAFDTYRAETLARLEEEAKAFAAYRDRLRVAKDRAAFERFMDEMKNTPTS
ncbi:DUF2852 domain-containing protein [Actibacterium sp. 188UL27-1]|uniref:DUF2852 domain-containing protein n=1 Tax=Actibacterium sp. 188UL27-1 TaxID=2786961 RepID=UPI00195DBE55|nr:DUF2852 domain-containing protein [Actibacterium sp. 188UL27-1]MBM7068923.1 DUF2852 domain-containing protein [Actibacterium sp. 188UL27-1]